jgi:tetratricopeptide (TPR) repeat protein
MNSEKFAQLLLKSEGNTIDFKRDVYNFAGLDLNEKNAMRAAFVKDILSFANTPRDESAYIVLGVKRHPDGRIEKKGIPFHIDDNTLQQKVEDWIDPIPQFAYHEIEFEGLQFAVIEIDVSTVSDRPFMATKNSKGGDALKPSVIYWRRGSKNSEATGTEAKAIYRWFESLTKNEFGSSIPVPWTDFVSNSNLDDEDQKFILFLGLDDVSDIGPTESLAGINWGLVADFNPKSGTTGILKTVKPILEARRAVHILSKGDAAVGNFERSTHWYFARGMEGKESSQVGNKWTDWLKGYAADFRSKIEKFSKGSPGPVVAIAIWNDVLAEQQLRRCFENVTEMFGDEAVFIIVTDNDGAFSRLADETNAKLISIDFRHFFDGLDTYLQKRLSGPENIVSIPGADGTEKNIQPSDLAWIEEDLEVVHLSIGSMPNKQIGEVNEFLRGSGITWFDLSTRIDVEREKTNDLQRTLRDELLRRQAARINLYHRPGAGGSTIGRRILWELRREFPAVILRRCDPKETIERINKIFHISERPILILREGNLVPDERADELFNLLKGRQIPAVMFQISRRYNLPKQNERTFVLDTKLTTAEAYRFCEKLSQDAPGKKSGLNALITTNTEARSPFIFGLTAYHDEFHGIGAYIESHLAGLTESQVRIVLYLSIAYKYGHASIHQSHFAALLELPLTRKIDFGKALSAAGRGLLVDEGGGYWRPAHDLLAGEIIKQVLSKGLADPRNWTAKLVQVGMEFAEFCKSNREIQPEELRKLVERVFVNRADGDFSAQGGNSDSFAAFANDIPAIEGRLRLFEHLVNIYPDHSHLWAHLGRFYSIALQRLEPALEAIDRAIELDSEDNVLHHIKGMALRNSVYTDLNDLADEIVIIQKAKLASISFAKARELNSQDEHGYVSEVQLILRVLDKLSARGNKKAVQIAAESPDPWLRESFQNAEGLLSDLRELRRGDRLSKHEEICRGDLDVLYGEHEQALQRWQNLIDSKDGAGNSLVYAPPIRRQIVWTLLARVKRLWAKMKGKDLERSINLLSLNIDEDPADEKSIRLWLHGARHSYTAPSLDAALERVTYWRASTASLDSAYYSYVLFSIDVLRGSSLNFEKAVKAMEETKGRSRFRRDSKISFEWLGKGKGLDALVHQSELGEWSEKNGFWENSVLLARVDGVVISLSGPHAGEIELPGGLRAFFVPGTTDLIKGRDLNARVSCYVGFSYEGLRAWAVFRA